MNEALLVTAPPCSDAATKPQPAYAGAPEFQTQGEEARSIIMKEQRGDRSVSGCNGVSVSSLNFLGV